MTAVKATGNMSKESTPKLTLLPLTALVVGSMIGGGVFKRRAV